MAFWGEGSMTSWKLYTKVCSVGWCWCEDRDTGKRYTIFRRRIKKFPHSQMSPQVNKNCTGQLHVETKLIKPSSDTQELFLFPRKN